MPSYGRVRAGQRPCNPKNHVRQNCWAEHERRARQKRPINREIGRPGEEDILELAYILSSHLPQLTTFSLIVDNEPEDGPGCACSTSRFSSQFLVPIVSSLPVTCVDLEIDTRGADCHPTRYGRSYTTFSPRCDHVCVGLEHVLPRLRSLRLRLGGLCPEFFLPIDYNLSEYTFSYLPGSAMQKCAWTQGFDGGEGSYECLDELELEPLMEDLSFHEDWLKLPVEEKQVLPLL